MRLTGAGVLEEIAPNSGYNSLQLPVPPVKVALPLCHVDSARPRASRSPHQWRSLRCRVAVDDCHGVAERLAADSAIGCLLAQELPVISAPRINVGATDKPGAGIRGRSEGQHVSVYGDTPAKGGVASGISLKIDLFGPDAVIQRINKSGAGAPGLLPSGAPTTMVLAFIAAE